MSSHRLAPEAADDLENIWLELEQLSPATARRTIRAILSKLDLLSGMPNAGHRRSEVPDDMRTLHVRGWIILYRVLGDQAFVVRIVSARSDLRALHFD